MIVAEFTPEVERIELAVSRFDATDLPPP